MNKILVDRGALQMAANIMRRVWADEAADALLESATELTTELATLRAANARQAELIAEFEKAFTEARDTILNGRGPLEGEIIDNDQTNAVLDVLDFAFSFRHHGHALRQEKSND